MFYSKKTRGFYETSIHGENIPSDAVEISFERWRELLDGQSEGMQIVADENGFPTLIAQPEPLNTSVEDTGEIASGGDSTITP